MREFEHSHSRLTNLSWEIKTAYTAFLGFCFFAYVVIFLLAVLKTGFTNQDYVDYYQGNESREMYKKTYGELVETTHFHLFSYPVFLLIQGHIFLLTAWPRSIKAAVVVASFVGSALYLAAPWLVIYGSSHFAWIGFIGRWTLAISLFLYLVVPLYEMWFKRSPCPTNNR
ncbi:MAG TPA: hypothetical protein EYQ50_24560 [Verrucomicrobiales bacterium]|nr:hypothetical protein [Verrucomicrobiales bacterium]HIL71544.1 hypothetical protein [Verrucomicrobiota bacterium]